MIEEFSAKLIYLLLGILVGWVTTVGIYQKYLFLTNKRMDEISVQVKRLSRSRVWK
jgi:hypothetical protein